MTGGKLSTADDLRWQSPELLSDWGQRCQTGEQSWAWSWMEFNASALLLSVSHQGTETAFLMFLLKCHPQPLLTTAPNKTKGAAIDTSQPMQSTS